MAMSQLSHYLTFCLIYWTQTLGSSETLADRCVCPGDILSYDCTTVGRGATVWQGSALDCHNGNPNEIVLLHSRFLNKTTTWCNNGLAVARSISVEGKNYTSQLNINVTPDTAGKTIECCHDNGTTCFLVFSSVIPTTGPPSAPGELCLSTADYSSREVTFNWSSVDPDCPSISYNILSSNCGSCPTTTNHTNVDCTDVPGPMANTTCQFAIQSVACGNITGNTSDPLNVTFFASEPTHEPTSVHVNSSTHNTDATETVSTLSLDKSMVYIDKSTGKVYTISISSLAAALMVSIVVSIAVIVICFTIMTRGKAEIKTLKHQLTNSTGGGRAEMELTYADITSGSLSASAIKTEDNFAYVKKHTPSNPNDELIYDEIIQTSRIYSQDNVAYSHAQTLTTTVQAEETTETL